MRGRGGRSRAAGGVLAVGVLALVGCTSTVEPEHTIAELREAPDTLSVNGVVFALVEVEVGRNIDPSVGIAGIGGGGTVRLPSGENLPSGFALTGVWIVHEDGDLFAPREEVPNLEIGQTAVSAGYRFRNGPAWAPFGHVDVAVEIRVGERTGLLGAHGVRIQAYGH